MSTAAGLPQFGSAALSTSPLASVALSTAAAAAAGKQIEGEFFFGIFGVKMRSDGRWSLVHFPLLRLFICGIWLDLCIYDVVVVVVVP